MPLIPVIFISAETRRISANGRTAVPARNICKIYTWRNWNKKTAAYEKAITVEPTDRVLGGTFCAWENNYDAEISVVRENLAAMSEKVWNVNSDMTHEELRASLKKLLRLAEKIT